MAARVNCEEIDEAGTMAEISSAMQPACNDNRALDKALDQYYTRVDVAAWCLEILSEHFVLGRYQMIEPSAGTGSFFSLLPAGSIAYDVDPKCPGIETADFLTVKIESTRGVVIVGNPPFGRNASMAVRFFNHAARQSLAIALILPRTFRKASIQNRLDRDFHLLREETVPDDAFVFRSKPYDVPATFQIWERRTEPRMLWPEKTRHPDFEFTKSCCADFAIQRVGVRAGRVHHDLTVSSSSHYFIKGNVETIMRQLDFGSVVGNVAGNPSLSKAEIVALYSKRIVQAARDHGQTAFGVNQTGNLESGCPPEV
jgi:predicted RNA methylase